METWIALLGRRDEPTDGVEDYCRFLANALRECGISLEVTRVAWDKVGWFRGVRNLFRESKPWEGRWVLVHYTALAWSRRGFPVGAVIAARIVRSRGARCAVVFHEFSRQSSGRSWIDHLRGAVQGWVIRSLYQTADKAIFTVPLDVVQWLPTPASKAHFAPIGANIPECLDARLPAQHGNPKTVLVFGVTGSPHMAGEVEVISSVMRHAAKAVPALRLVLCGRGSSEASALLSQSLQGLRIEIVTRGLLPGDEIANEMQRADVHLFVRGPITLQRGSALAGIACGVPIVGYRNGNVMRPLDEAGIEWAALGDSSSLAQNLVAVLQDDEKWAELHARNVRLQRNFFAWNRIAHEYVKAFSQ